jgi:hypothetical protein
MTPTVIRKRDGGTNEIMRFVPHSGEALCQVPAFHKCEIAGVVALRKPGA